MRLGVLQQPSQSENREHVNRDSICGHGGFGEWAISGVNGNSNCMCEHGSCCQLSHVANDPIMRSDIGWIMPGWHLSNCFLVKAHRLNNLSPCRKLLRILNEAALPVMTVVSPGQCSYGKEIGWGYIPLAANRDRGIRCVRVAVLLFDVMCDTTPICTPMLLL